MPVVFIDPADTYAAVGETFIIRLKAFNLTCNFHGTDEEWFPGDPLPPTAHHSDPRYNYSLGNLYSFTVSMSWDPAILEYIGHQVMVPVETYPDGILNSPADKIEESVDPIAGTILVTYGSRNPAEEFNKPNDNATIFKMIFTVKTEGSCNFNLDNVVLYQRQIKYPDAAHRIPQWSVGGSFQSPTGVYVTEVTTLKYERYVAKGQDLGFNVSVTNDGETQETFDLNVSATEIETGIDPVIYEGEITLDSGETITLVLSLATETEHYGVYRLDAYISTTGHSWTSWIVIVMAGDVDADKDVDIYDVVAVCGVYGLCIGDSGFDPNKDIILNGCIDIYDVVLMCSNYGKTYEFGT
jgi:hypothetical protein